MFLANLNFVTIFVASVINIILGTLWYSEKMFGATWMRLSGIAKPENFSKVMMARIYAGAFILNILFTTVFASVLGRYYVFSLIGALTVAVAVWAGLVLPVLSGGVLWEGKPLKLLAIHSGYYLVSLVIASVILYAF